MQSASRRDHRTPSRTSWRPLPRRDDAAPLRAQSPPTPAVAPGPQTPAPPGPPPLAAVAPPACSPMPACALRPLPWPRRRLADVAPPVAQSAPPTPDSAHKRPHPRPGPHRPRPPPLARLRVQYPPRRDSTTLRHSGPRPCKRPLLLLRAATCLRQLRPSFYHRTRTSLRAGPPPGLL